MSLQVATALSPGAVVEAEVAIVGAGPAGLALAGELAAGGVDVVLLEAGGSRASTSASRDDRPELVIEEGGATFHSDRRFGGARWYGRCVAPDPVDFERRSWLPGSGWPIPMAELTRFVEPAARWLGIERPAALDPAFWRDDAAWRLLEGGGVAPIVHLITSQRDLGRRARPSVRANPRIRALLGATLVGFDFSPRSGRVERVRFAATDGGERVARARSFVLACGGVENARQLLLLDELEPGRFGGAALGEGFFDHPRCDGFARLHLDPSVPAARSVYRRLIEHLSSRAGCRAQLAVGIAPERQRAEELLNPCGFFYPTPLRRIARRDGLLPLLAAGARGARGRRRRLAPLALVEQLEQVPSGSGRRVELGSSRDRLGLRRARVRWRVDDETRRTQRRFHELLAERINATGVGRLESPLLTDIEARPVYGDAGHPMGATRMSPDPSRGVVDADARVHGIENLYVAGTSVFPVSGHANPTLTLVALAFRLADHLAGHRKTHAHASSALAGRPG
jgi:choline dehydrogenase-like flavoprotein